MPLVQQAGRRRKLSLASARFEPVVFAGAEIVVFGSRAKAQNLVAA